MKFTEFGFNSELLEGIDAIGYETATPIQEKAIPTILEGKDLIASAQTGTGKTAAFLLPVIQQIMQAGDHHGIKALVIVPTRELAIQIDQHVEGLSYFTSVSSIAVYGGGDGSLFAKEKQALSSGVDIVVGTPGRLISHLNLGYVKAQNLKCLILDEADRMLDMGFHADIMKIISYLPSERQTLMFSATMPPKIRELARKTLRDPEEISLAVSKPAERVTQVAFLVYDKQKIPLVKYLLRARDLRSALIFCSTKSSAKDLSRELKRNNLPVEDIHSDLDQAERNQVMLKFKNRELQILVATDILSRGIDIEDIDVVINYDVPNDGEDYIHRIGRTARAASKGYAFTFVNEKEQRKFLRIEELLGEPVKKARLPEELGSSPAYNPGRPHQKKDFKGRNKKRRFKNPKKSK